MVVKLARIHSESNEFGSIRSSENVEKTKSHANKENQVVCTKPVASDQLQIGLNLGCPHAGFQVEIALNGHRLTPQHRDSTGNHREGRMRADECRV
ncbi:hypothetical protein N7G274_006415 [Stereocaulon virgatum]|uniref:Uncharacterized protein n=1 Tax=Stereocaulon virgatum TaxID=373712 RepID=A0ABR4A4X0_9LECA